jgi:hypothetical protein
MSNPDAIKRARQSLQSAELLLEAGDCEGSVGRMEVTAPSEDVLSPFTLHLSP